MKKCIKCNKENEDIKVVCDCGSQYFISGQNFNINGNDVTCKCGGDFQDSKIIENSKELIIKEYKCDSCGNKINIEKNIGAITRAVKHLQEVK